MSEETTKLDPVDTYLEYEARRMAEERLHERKWTAAEVLELRAEHPEKHAALAPYIEESHRRGDFRYLHELTRQEAEEHFKERGVSGPVFSTGEMQAITRDEKLYRDYGGELQEARRDGRIILHPDPKEVQRGRVVHFAGESFDSPDFTKGLNAKLESIDKRRKADAVLKETRDELEQISEERIGSSALKSYLRRQLDAAWLNHSKLYPVEERPGYREVLERYEALGGKL